jgi:short-subunit dehydrogenase
MIKIKPDSQVQLKYVLVTGASSGIGREIANLLAKNGIYVFACARKPEDIEALNNNSQITGLRMDITSIGEIRSVAHQLKMHGISLYGIINNAGVAIGGPLISLDDAEIRASFEVNCIGHMNVVRELFPLLERNGYIINISSIGALYVSPWMAPYHMAKFALEAYSDALRIELAPFGIKVVIIEPGAVKTAANQKEDRFKNQIYNTIYEKAFREYWGMIEKQHKKSLHPSVIALLILKILSNRKPKKRYLVPHRKLFLRIAFFLSKFGLLERVYSKIITKNVSSSNPHEFLHRIS